MGTANHTDIFTIHTQSSQLQALSRLGLRCLTRCYEGHVAPCLFLPLCHSGSRNATHDVISMCCPISLAIGCWGWGSGQVGWYHSHTSMVARWKGKEILGRLSLSQIQSELDHETWAALNLFSWLYKPCSSLISMGEIEICVWLQ